MQSHLCYVDCRLGIPFWNTEYENPCVRNFLGATFCFNCQWMIRFFQTIDTLVQEYCSVDEGGGVNELVDGAGDEML